MNIWKLGTTWGPVKEGKPSFYDFIKKEQIVISVHEKKFQKGDLVAIASGFKIRALAKVLKTPSPVMEMLTLKSKFIELQIDFENWVEYAIAEWYEIPKDLQFDYPNQTGICQIRGDYNIKIANLWNNFISSVNYEKKTFEEIRNASKLLNPFYNMPKNQILFGPPGTGKTYNTINKAIEIANPVFNIKQGRREVKKEFDRLVNEGKIVFTTFHQSMSYEDFVEGIKPQEPKEGESMIRYEVEDGIFKRVCKKANLKSSNYEEVLEAFKTDIFEGNDKEPITIEARETTFDVTYRGTNVFYVQPKASKKENPWYPVNIRNIEKAFETGNYDGIYNPTYVREIINYLKKERDLHEGDEENNSDKPHVLIIDEINRGNVSQIFGELITLLEADKRQGMGEALEVILPYSKEKFSVPSNLYVIGTMNTADRSVEALDAALRRRFSFEEMPPKPELIEQVGKANNENVGGINLIELMNTINKRIEMLLDKDHLIGHAYFLNVSNLDDLKSVFKNNIVPLLQEYFYGDYGKIGLVLGEGFFENNGKQPDNQENIFADFNGYDTSMLLDKQIYSMKKFSDKEDVDFIDALNSLIGKEIKFEPQKQLEYQNN